MWDSGHTLFPPPQTSELSPVQAISHPVSVGTPDAPMPFEQTMRCQNVLAHSRESNLTAFLCTEKTNESEGVVETNKHQTNLGVFNTSVDITSRLALRNAFVWRHASVDETRDLELKRAVGDNVTVFR